MIEEDKLGDILYDWQAKEFSSNQRTTSWYVGAGIILLLVIVYTVYIKQWIALGVVIFAGLLIFLAQRMAPRVYKHQIGSKGIAVGEKSYLYSNIKSFWIVSNIDNPTLNLVLNKKYSLLLTLQLGTADVEKIRKLVGEHLPEDTNKGEDTADKISRFLKL